MTNTTAWNQEESKYRRITQIPKDIVWLDLRLDFTSGNLDYKGSSRISVASTSAGDLWYVWKYTWSTGDLVRVQGPIVGNWDDRAALSWA